MPEPITLSLLLSGFFNIASTVVNTFFEFFKILPVFVQFLLVSAILWFDIGPNIVGSVVTNLITQWIGIKITSFILFALTLVIGLIGITHSANKYLSSS